MAAKQETTSVSVEQQNNPNVLQAPLCTHCEKEGKCGSCIAF